MAKQARARLSRPSEPRPAEGAAELLLGLPPVGFLAWLPREAVELLVDGAPGVEYPYGSRVLLGAGTGQLCLVASGLLRYYLADTRGREITIRYIGPGGIAGSLVPGGSGVATGLQAVETSTILHVDGERLRELADRDPRVARALLEETTERLRRSYRALAGSAFRTLKARLAHDIVERSLAGGGTSRLAIRQQELADATGSVREVVARTLAELRGERIIDTDRGGITILDLPALEAARGSAPRASAGPPMPAPSGAGTKPTRPSPPALR